MEALNAENALLREKLADQFEIEIRVHASSSTGASAVRNIDLTIKSRSASAARDIVRAHVTRN